MIENLTSILPELLLLLLSCALLLIDLWLKPAQKVLVYWLTLASLLVVAAALALSWSRFSGSSLDAGGMIVVDEFSLLLKLLATGSVFAALVYGRSYMQQRGMLDGSLFLLALFALLGIFIMVSANHLVIIYLGLELLTLASYALVSLRRSNLLALEAAMKYFVLGALASGFLLYGMSMLYGSSGSLYLTDIRHYILQSQQQSMILILALVFVVAGIAFKLGVVPFHMWVPDVYHGAPTIITQLIATAPKFGALAMTIRLLAVALVGLSQQWQQMLMLLALASLVLGNFAAIMQSNIKRMLAFSTIAQIAFILLALVAAGATTEQGQIGALQIKAYAAALYYLIGYVVTLLTIFGLLLRLSGTEFEADRIADLAGLNQRSPIYAAILALGMFSLAGIPPLLGFYTKLVVLQTLLATGIWMHLLLAILAVLLSLIAAFYYLRVIKVIYFDAAEQPVPLPPTNLVANLLLGSNVLLLIWLSLFPQGLMALCEQIMRQFFIG